MCKYKKNIILHSAHFKCNELDEWDTLKYQCFCKPIGVSDTKIRSPPKTYNFNMIGYVAFLWAGSEAVLLKYLTQYLGLDDHLVSVLNMLKNVQAYLNRLIDFLPVVIAR